VEHAIARDDQIEQRRQCADSEKRELTIDELSVATGGAVKPCMPTSNVLKTRHDTAKNSISNVR